MTDYLAAEVAGPGEIRLTGRRLGQLGPRDVVARVHASGICGTDVGIYEGTLSYFKTGLMRFPVVPGHEWSGVVAEVGPEVTRVKPGDRITSECHIGCAACGYCRRGRYNLCPDRARVGLVGIEGAFGELIVVPERAVHRLPPELDLDAGALIEPATVAFRAVEQLGAIAGQRALVLGAGPIGLLTTLFLRAAGVGWLAVAGLEPGRLAVARSLGADVSLNSADVDPGVAARAATDGEGADVVVEATGASGLIPTALEAAAPGGSLVLVSMYKQRPVGLAADPIVAKDLTVHGTIASPGVWERTIRLLASGRVDPRPLISHRFPLADPREAVELARGRADGALKVLVTPNG